LPMQIFSDLKYLLFPTRCFGCRELGYSICSQCRKQWNPHLYQSRISGLAVYSAIPYSPIAKNILLAAKEQNVKSADQLVRSAVKVAIYELFQRHSNCALVPIPSGVSSNRRRGRDFVNEMAISVAKDFGVAVLPLLEHQRNIRDQSRLDIASRRQNLAMAFSIKPQFRGNYSGENVVILDDLVTTGATISEANRALTRGGFRVQAAATACVALRRRE
jgi:predicted amidophosphoribosyltransferase